jgi:carboxyl-terminal processing protease
MNHSSRKLSFFQGLLFGSAIAALSTGALLFPSFGYRVNAELEDNPKAVVDEVWQLVNQEFVDRSFNQVEWAKIRQDLLKKDYNSYDQAYREIRKALRLLGDPYTRFLDPQEFEVLTSQTSGELSGVGIRMDFDEQSRQLIVVEPLVNSPAWKAGIRKGDRILQINGKNTSLMSLEQASEEIRGAVGTNVELQISRPSGEVLKLSLTRSQIELPSVSYTMKQENQLNVGYIKLDEFSSHAAEQMKKAIEELSLKEPSAFVLDLRGNPGGLLFASVDIARMWMNTGEIVSTIDSQRGHRHFSANRTALTDLPLVVLVDKNSASASEILAGALKDNKRATIVGTQTYGKGTVQSLHTLSDGSGLAVTISRYFPPSGININHHGITPDISLELSQDEQLNLQVNPSLIATQSDPQYRRAISFLYNSNIGQGHNSNAPVSIRQQ